MITALKLISVLILALVQTACDSALSRDAKPSAPTDLNPQVERAEDHPAAPPLQLQKADLVCGLFAQDVTAAKIINTPLDSFRINLLERADGPQTGMLSSADGEQSIDVTVDIRRQAETDLTIHHADGTEERLAKTPMIVVDYSYQQTRYNVGGLVMSANGSGSQLLHVRGPALLVNQFSAVQGAIPSSNHVLECSIDSGFTMVNPTPGSELSDPTPEPPLVVTPMAPEIL